MTLPSFIPQIPLSHHRTSTPSPTSLTSLPRPSLPSRRRISRPRPRPCLPTISASASQPPITRLSTTSAISAALQPPSASPSPRISVLAFTQPNCRACAYASRAYARLSSSAPLPPRDEAHAPGFYEVDVGDVAVREAVERLGVRNVPSWRVFVGDGAVGQVFEVAEFEGARGVGEVGGVVERLMVEGFVREEWEME